MGILLLMVAKTFAWQLSTASKDVKSPFCATSVKINAAMDCNSQNLVYGIFCEKKNFKQLYIGEKN